MNIENIMEKNILNSIELNGNRGKQRLYNWYLKLYNLIKLRTTIETIALRIFFFSKKIFHTWKN